MKYQHDTNLVYNKLFKLDSSCFPYDFIISNLASGDLSLIVTLKDFNFFSANKRYPEIGILNIKNSLKTLIKGYDLNTCFYDSFSPSVLKLKESYEMVIKTESRMRRNS